MNNEPNMTNEDGDDVDLSELRVAPEETPEEAPEGVGDVAPKRRGRPKGSRNILSSVAGTARKAGRVAKGTVVKQQIAMLTGLANMLVAQTRYRDDCLNPAEMDLLTNALTAEAMSSERIVKWMLAASGVTPHLLLLQAVVVIATPRLQRHGILPSLGAPKEAEHNVATGQFGEPTETPTETQVAPDYSPFTVPVEAGGAPIPVGGHW